MRYQWYIRYAAFWVYVYTTVYFYTREHPIWAGITLGLAGISISKILQYWHKLYRESYPKKNKPLEPKDK